MEDLRLAERGRNWNEENSGFSLARILLSDLRDQSPPDLTALYTEVQEGQALISGIKMGIGALTVQRWDPTYAASGWTLYGRGPLPRHGPPVRVDVLPQNDADGRVLRVGVKWHPPVLQQLEFLPCTRRSQS